MQLSLRQAGSDEPAPSFKSTTRTQLDLPPSCIEFAPGQQEYFVVGTYHLESKDEHEAENREAEQTRSGSLILFHLQGDNLSLLQTVPTPFAVLDLHFSKHEPNIFAIATSTGSVCLYTLDVKDKNSDFMKQYFLIQIADPSVLVLSLAWSPFLAQASTLAISLSSGQIEVFDYLTPGNPSRTIQAHSLEAWTVSWSLVGDVEKPRILYSGGDDSAICMYSEENLKPRLDLGDEPAIHDIYEPIDCDMKTHGAGVTAILPVAIGNAGEEILLTGSYDEFLRILMPVAKSTRLKVLAEQHLGGGVWRITLLKASQLATDGHLTLKILASSMHAGARVVDIGRSEEHKWTIQISAKFEEHESMNYASDARIDLGGNSAERVTYVSTSFYDKKLCIWHDTC